ncbi:unnamed protein product [Calypogeia fissa]
MACICGCGDDMPDSMAWKNMQNEALVKAQRTLGTQEWNTELRKMEPLSRRLLPFQVFQILSDDHFYMLDIIKGLTCSKENPIICLWHLAMPIVAVQSGWDLRETSYIKLSFHEIAKLRWGAEGGIGSFWQLYNNSERAISRDRNGRAVKNYDGWHDSTSTLVDCWPESLDGDSVTNYYRSCKLIDSPKSQSEISMKLSAEGFKLEFYLQMAELWLYEKGKSIDMDDDDFGPSPGCLHLHSYFRTAKLFA